jgi:hypothetical protein
MHGQIVYEFIKNKKLLVISPFSKLIKSQIDRGNYKHIYPNATTVEYCLEYTYTSFNNGPHNNILETAENNLLNKSYVVYLFQIILHFKVVIQLLFISKLIDI